MRMRMCVCGECTVCMCVRICSRISSWEAIVGIPVHLTEEHNNMATHSHERSGFVFPEDRIMACHSWHGLPTYGR